jgi:hypothetical protein
MKRRPNVEQSAILDWTVESSEAAENSLSRAQDPSAVDARIRLRGLELAAANKAAQRENEARPKRQSLLDIARRHDRLAFYTRPTNPRSASLNSRAIPEAIRNMQLTQQEDDIDNVVREMENRYVNLNGGDYNNKNPEPEVCKVLILKDSGLITRKGC